MELKGKRVFVTGGSGFLGSYLIPQLKLEGAEVHTVSSSCLDLREKINVDMLYRVFKPDVVIHLAANCGGIGANQAAPGAFFYDNLMMGMLMIEGARKHGIEKFVQVGTVCAYPKFTPAPFKETDIWNGYPEETNAPYGIAKKALLVQCQAYRQQYGLNAIYVVPVNLYGPRDNFDFNTSHVIPALIRKCLEAKQNGDRAITVWGTGTASREFLYAEDCADAIILATRLYDGSEPVNIGSGQEITINNLVDLVMKVTGYTGEVIFDSTKPDGQPRRVLETSRAKESFGFSASTSLEDGLRLTTEWYEQSIGSNKLVRELREEWPEPTPKRHMAGRC